MSETTFLDRLKCEKEELDEKLTKLTGFAGTDKFKELSPKHQTLLRRQHKAMEAYSKILGERLEDLKQPA